MLGKAEYPVNGGQYYGVFQESSLKYVGLPPTAKKIEYNAFKGCKNLKSINLPEKLEYVGK